MKTQIIKFYVAMRDSRTPWYARGLLLLLICYVVSPIDIIPDFIPVLGLLDEAILLPVALAVIYRMIPPELLQQDEPVISNREKYCLLTVGVILVSGVWLLLLVAAYRLAVAFE